MPGIRKKHSVRVNQSYAPPKLAPKNTGTSGHVTCIQCIHLKDYMSTPIIFMAFHRLSIEYTAWHSPKMLCAPPSFSFRRLNICSITFQTLLAHQAGWILSRWSHFGGHHGSSSRVVCCLHLNASKLLLRLGAILWFLLIDYLSSTGRLHFFKVCSEIHAMFQRCTKRSLRIFADAETCIKTCLKTCKNYNAVDPMP